MRGIAGLLIVPLVAMALALTPGASPFDTTARAAAATNVVGDADCDGGVTATDVSAAMRAIAGFGGGCAASLADVNCSGGLDMADVRAIRRHVASLPVDAQPGCPAIGTSFELSGPSSTERIEAALAAGTITKGQALLYHLLSDFDPTKLPMQFRGPVDPDADSHGGSSLFEEAAANWDSFSQSEKEALTPFLLPPADPESWFADGGNDAGLQATAAVQWETVSNDRIKVWWQASRPEDAAKAAAMLEELDTYIWPELVTYMGAQHAPLSDIAQTGNGGDGRYDIYLVHNAPTEPGKEPVLGWVSPMLDGDSDVSCKVTPSYMVFNSRGDLSQAKFSTLAHEFMHSVQFTYNVGSCEDYRWLRESTAVWVESWLYPEVNEEHGFAAKYLEQLDQKPLEYWAYADERQYGSYLLWYHAQHNEGLFHAVRDTWAASANADSLVAVNTGLAGAGGLKDVWPESALFNSNREPYDDFLVQDQLPYQATWVDTEVKATTAATSYAVPTDVGHLQQRHLSYSVDSSVKRLTFINSLYTHWDPDAKVQALIEINGQWQAEAVDWTNEDRVSFCTDLPNEKVTRLVLIVTNANYTDRSHVIDAGPSELVASKNGCTGWTGSTTATIQYHETTFHISVDNLRFELDPEDPGNERYDFYELTGAGTATWTVSGTWFGTCTPSGTMPLDAPLTSDVAIHGYLHVDKIDNTFDVYVGGNSYEDTLEISCPNSDPWYRSWPVSGILVDGAIWRPIPEDGSISVEYSETSYPGVSLWQWNLNAP